MQEPLYILAASDGLDAVAYLSLIITTCVSLLVFVIQTAFQKRLELRNDIKMRELEDQNKRHLEQFAKQLERENNESLAVLTANLSYDNELALERYRNQLGQEHLRFSKGYEGTSKIIPEVYAKLILYRDAVWQYRNTPSRYDAPEKMEAMKGARKSQNEFQAFFYANELFLENEPAAAAKNYFNTLFRAYILLTGLASIQSNQTHIENQIELDQTMDLASKQLDIMRLEFQKILGIGASKT